MDGLPDFLVIGAARAGTTALHGYLRQHPGLRLPQVKETNFFAFAGETLTCRGPGAEFINNSITDLDRYRSLFDGAPAGARLGEVCPLYLYAPTAPARIRALVPDVRLVAILRNPVEQAFSHFLYATKMAIEPETDFLRALDLEEDRLAQGWQPLFGYSRFPRYGEQLARYLALFPRDRILVRRYEAFQTDPARLMAEILDFIGADPGFRPDMREKPNAGGVPKSRLFQDFLMRKNPVTTAIGLVVPQETRLRIRDRLARLNLRREDAMPPKARAILQARLADDIAALGRLLDEDFSDWLR